jgi:sterol desaturase/sphingolipid hydroxylase (fatty acid hydroxylase superfamily)
MARGGRIMDLGQMSLGDLVRATVTYPSMILYAVLVTAAVIGAVWLGAGAHPWRTLLAVGLTLAIYPPVEYLLHRYVLHARWLYKNRFTADLWKRIHFDHHQDPQRLDVLFGSPSNTLPAVVIFTLPLGLLVNGWAGFLVAFATGLVIFSFYEFCHCVQHLNYVPRNAWLRRIKKHHMAHHFHNETGNFGITSTFMDRVVGSFYDDPRTRPRSPHVNDLGYDDAEAARYPWVRAHSAAKPGAPDARG